jgi:hypothetical protein
VVLAVEAGEHVEVGAGPRVLQRPRHRQRQAPWRTRRGRRTAPRARGGAAGRGRPRT